MTTIGPPSSYPAFGEVWWLNRPTGQRYFLFMSPPEVVKDSSNAHLHFCRLTSHSKTPFAQGGEWPLLFTNDRMPDLFPNSFRFKLGVGQAGCIDFMPKSVFSLPRPNLWDRLGMAHPRLLNDFRTMVRTVFTATPEYLPFKECSQDVRLDALRPGTILDLRYNSVGARPPKGVSPVDLSTFMASRSGRMLVVSSDILHKWYPEPAVVLVPVRDPAAPIELRYDYYRVHSLNLILLDELKISFATKAISVVSESERADAAAFCECVLGV